MNHEISPVAMKELRRVLIRWTLVLAACGVFAIWATCRMSTAASRLPATVGATDHVDMPSEPVIEYWTCTMHPEVQQPEAGDCPICGMQLIPKYVGSDEAGVKPVGRADALATAAGDHQHGGVASSSIEPASKAWYRCTMPECGDQGSSDPNSHCPVCGMKRERVDTGGESAGDAEIRLSERARHLAEVETEPARMRMLSKRIRATGRVGYDETRYKMVSAWINGRIDRLFADFTGMTVSKGDHLVEIYSPELLSAQEEYLQALRAVALMGDSTTGLARRSSDQLLRAAKRKLDLLGIGEDEITSIEQSGAPLTHLVIHAPIGGTIVEKRAMEGMYVKTGDTLYTIADLQHLWMLVDLYESDLPWVKPFQDARIMTRSLPGEVFTGKIVFVDPKMNPKTHTVQVRIHVDNPALRLKPDMWVTALIDAELSRGGRGAVPALQGAMACPMHPWETADDFAVCPICGMDMVAVADLPRYASPTDPVPLLSVPRSAVMQTGERAIVYVEASPGTYRGVEVTIGPLAQADDGRSYCPILSGLNEGERVVARGNFAIDSQMQLAGKPSLFTARGFGDATSHDMGDAMMHGDGGKQDPHAGHDMQHTMPENAGAALPEQKICPVMGNPINPDVFIEYQGVKIYFCCWGCDDKFLAEPEKYIDKLPPSIQAKLKQAGPKETADD